MFDVTFSCVDLGLEVEASFPFSFEFHLSSSSFCALKCWAHVNIGVKIFSWLKTREH